MRAILLFSICVFFFVGCSENGIKDVRQPLCEDVNCIQINNDWSIVPSDYNGVVKECENGKIMSLTNYIDGKQDFLTFWDSKGYMGEVNLKDGEPNGWFRIWYDNGQLKWEDKVTDGRPSLVFQKAWYKNGQLRTEVITLNGIATERCFDKQGNKIECD